MLFVPERTEHLVWLFAICYLLTCEFMSPASTQIASDQLAEMKRQFESCSAAAEQLVKSLAEGDLMQRPGNQGWSVAECIQHLTVTTQLYLPILDSSLQGAPAGSGPYKMDWKGRMLKWVLEPPYRMKAKTLPSMEPKVADARQVLPDFLASQQQLFEAMEQWQAQRIKDQIKGK